MAKKDEPNDRELFDISDAKVRYERSRDQKKVTATIRSSKQISELKLYLIYDREMQMLEKRLGISDLEDTVH
jgi:hypothetical protein